MVTDPPFIGCCRIELDYKLNHAAVLVATTLFSKSSPAWLSPSAPCQESGVLALPQTIRKLLPTSYFKMKKEFLKSARIIMILSQAHEGCKPGP